MKAENLRAMSHEYLRSSDNLRANKASTESFIAMCFATLASTLADDLENLPSPTKVGELEL